MKILISGASGLVGTALQPILEKDGHEIVALTRSAKRPEDIEWNPLEDKLDDSKLNGFDTVIHLAGENIASGRWTKARKQRIRDSRVKGTRLLCDALAQQETPPKTLLCASAIGYYGDRGDETMTEESTPGSLWISDICKDWEEATTPIAEKNIRVVLLRIGIVLSTKGGALTKMLTPFRLGVGGKVGRGDQYMSWIALDDVVGILHHALNNESLHGPVNVVAPNPVTNLTFTKTLGKVLSRPTIFPAPAFALRLALGDMADELLLASTRVLPKRLEKIGYEFQFTDLEGALRHVLK